MVQIIKASGEKETFDKHKIEQTAIKAGATPKLAKEISDKIKQEIKSGTTTKQILNKTINLLKVKPEVAARYDLKRAIMLLGPHGFSFEEYFSQILKEYGYNTKVGTEVQGKIVTQEIDIIAQNKFTYMIEAKYHNSLGSKTNTKVAMYTYARFLDIKSNPKNKFDQPWLVTNTKCTDRAALYAKGVNLKIISWKFPQKGNLQQLIEEKSLYPITIFKSISNPIKEKLFHAKVMMAKDLANYNLEELSKKTGLNQNILNKILDEAKRVCGDKVSLHQK